MPETSLSITEIKVHAMQEKSKKKNKKYRGQTQTQEAIKCQQREKKTSTQANTILSKAGATDMKIPKLETLPVGVGKTGVTQDSSISTIEKSGSHKTINTKYGTERNTSGPTSSDKKSNVKTSKLATSEQIVSN